MFPQYFPLLEDLIIVTGFRFNILYSGQSNSIIHPSISFRICNISELNPEPYNIGMTNVFDNICYFIVCQVSPNNCIMLEQSTLIDNAFSQS